MKYFIQFLLTVILFIFATAATWYEGSELLSRTLEWKYSTFFSQMINGEVIIANDISGLDFFIYAVKFQPFYPFLMMMSILYLLLLASYLVLGKNLRKFSLFLVAIGMILLILGTFVSDSPTAGGKYFNLVLNIMGILCLLNFIILHFNTKVKRATQPCSALEKRVVD